MKTPKFSKPALVLRETGNGHTCLSIVDETGDVEVARDMIYGEAMRQANVLLKTGLFSHIQDVETEEEAG